MGCPLSVPWDEASPSGATTPADTIDTEIQNLKVSIRERLEDIIPDWADDSVCPKAIDSELLGGSIKTKFFHYDSDSSTVLQDREVPLPVYLTVRGTTDGSGYLYLDLTTLTTDIEGNAFTGAEWSGQMAFSPFENIEVEELNETGDVLRFLIADSTGVTLTSFGPTWIYVTLVKKSPAEA